MARATGDKEKSLQMERIYVAVRARPLSPDESRSSPWQINGSSVSLANQAHKFEFDTIFGENCKTNEVYEARTKDIVASAASGFNGTVFAYGQTSSGKTHTMKGSDAEPGIIPLAIQDLFHAIQETGDREFLLRMSYMEIYNEEINDLLAPEHRKLQIHENTERGIYVAGLKEEIVNCPEQVLDLMKFGESHRHIGETNMNLYSSRSHTIFRMIIESREKVEDNELNDSCDAVRVSVLNLVDLAGSERVAKTGAEGKRLKEGSHINKSLLTLGSVIQKLSEGAQSQGGHVPYRDSKLTRILQPALGGNANTAIICNITLAQIHADETKSSLQFASRAKRVTNCVRVNEILTDAALLKRQKKEIEELRAKLMVSHNEQWEEQILTLRNTLLQSELEKERISLELEEEKKAKAQREERLLEQARKIENLSSLVLLSDRDEKSVLSSKSQKKRRETWCPAHSVPQVVTKDISRLHRASSGTALLPFETLIEEDESCLDELEDRNTDEIPFPEALSLLNVTSRRKISSKENNEDTEYWSSAEKLNEQTGTPGRNTIKSLTLRESEAILVIKQLEDQIKMLELEKASTQNYLDDVLKLATQQNNSFTKKYEEMQQEVFKAREEARIAQEKLLSVKSFEETLLENVAPTQSEVLKVVEGLSLRWDQSKNSTDGLICFVEDLLQNFSILSKMLQNIKSSADGEVSEFKSVISEFEMLTIQLFGKAKDLSLEKSLLEGQLIYSQREIAKLKSDMDCCDNSIAREYQNLAMNAVEMKSEIASLEGILINTIAEKEEALTRLEVVTSKLEELSKMTSSAESEIDSLKEEVENKTHKLKEAELLVRSSKSCCESLQKEKEEMEMQLTDALLEAEAQKSMWLSKERTIIEVTKHKKTSDYEIQRLASDLSQAKLELEACREECKLLKKSSDDMILQLNMEKDRLMANISTLEAKIHDENVAPTQSEVLKVVEGLSVRWDQSKNSTDGLICFVEDLLQNFSILLKMLQNIKSSADGEVSEFKSVISEFEMLTIQLFGKAKDLSLEKSLLEGQLIDSHREIAKLKSDMDCYDNSIAEYVAATHTEILEEIEGLSLLWDQSKNSTDGLFCFVEDLFHNFSVLSKMLQNVNLSVDGEILEFKSVFSEFEILTIQLSGKAKDINLEKSLLEGQLIDCQREIAELKCVMDSREKTLAEMNEQHELEKEELCTQLVMMQNEIAVLSSSSLMCEIESLRKELDRAKTKLKDTESKLKTAIHEKIKLEGEKAHAGREIKELKSQMALLERDIRKHESKLTDLAKKKESTGEINHNLMREYQNLEMNAVEMKSEIALLEGILINTIAEKEEALTRLEVVTSELEELSKMTSSAESEIDSLKEEVENKTHKLKEAELLVRSSKSCCESLQKEKEEMEMQLTDALLEAEAQKSMWLSKERTIIEVTKQKKTSDYEIQRLASDLSQAKLELEACREECKLLKKSSDDMILQLNMEKDRLMENISTLEAKIHDDLEQQLVTVTIERDSLMCTNEKLCLKINEAENLRKNYDHTISQLKTEKDKLMANISTLETKIHDDLECQLVAITKERDALICRNEKMCLEINEAEVLRQNSDHMVLNAKMERDELAARISAMEAKMHEDKLRYETEITKCLCRCRSMQEKVDGYKGKYAELLKEHKRMNEKFKEASDTLKDKLREYGLEILKLKKELASNKGGSACASTSAQ